MKDPTKLSDQELSEKIGKILDRMNFFSQTGHSDAYAQALTIYHSLCAEQLDRIQRNYIKDDDQFGDLIDIGKK